MVDDIELNEAIKIELGKWCKLVFDTQMELCKARETLHLALPLMRQELANQLENMCMTDDAGRPMLSSLEEDEHNAWVLPWRIAILGAETVIGRPENENEEYSDWLNDYLDEPLIFSEKDDSDEQLSN